MTIGHELETHTGLSLKRPVRTLKRYRAYELPVGGSTINVVTPLPNEVHNIIQQATKT